MEYISTGDLPEAVRKGAFPRKKVVSALVELGETLAYAHARGIVHRDVKPANVLVTRGGALKLTDFDLVRALDTTGGTRTTAMGTVFYAAPEQTQDAKSAEPSVDVFALGRIGQFILHGRDLAWEVMMEAERFMNGLEWPPGLRPIVERACAFRPADRYASAAEMVEALKALERAAAPG
jgi:serine/threonine protein kinase